MGDYPRGPGGAPNSGTGAWVGFLQPRRDRDPRGKQPKVAHRTSRTTFSLLLLIGSENVWAKMYTACRSLSTRQGLCTAVPAPMCVYRAPRSIERPSSDILVNQEGLGWHLLGAPILHLLSFGPQKRKQRTRGDLCGGVRRSKGDDPPTSQHQPIAGGVRVRLGRQWGVPRAICNRSGARPGNGPEARADARASRDGNQGGGGIERSATAPAPAPEQKGIRRVSVRLGGLRATHKTQNTHKQAQDAQDAQDAKRPASVAAGGAYSSCRPPS